MRIEYPSWSQLFKKTHNRLLDSNYVHSVPFHSLDKHIKHLIARYRASGDFQEIIQRITSLESKKSSGMPLKSFDEIKSIFPTRSNEFSTCFDIRNWKYVHVSEEIKEVLGVQPEDFSINELAGIPNVTDGLIHPEDLPNFMRFAMGMYLFSSFHTPKEDSLECFYNVNFRIRKAEEDKYHFLHKKSVISEFFLPEKGGASHIDVWNLDCKVENFSRVTYSVNVPNNIQAAKAYNDCLALINARLLNFNSKELGVIHYLKQYKNVRYISEQLNQDFSSDKFNLRSMNDYVYKLRKKIKKTYKEMLQYEYLDENSKKRIEAIDAESLALKMGLADFSQEFFDEFKTMTVQNINSNLTTKNSHLVHSKAPIPKTA